jgi:hypothetical protein
MPLREATHYRARSIAAAVVIGGHVALLVLLAARHERAAGAPEERMTLVFIDSLEEPGLPPLSDRPTRATRPVRPRLTEPAPVPAPDASESTTITPGIDWYANGSEAAQRAAAEPTVRTFDFPRREPAPRERKPFGWDKVHTERVHALAGGGIGIRLSENCELILVPLPLGGCALGKRKARGDLFDEMKAPAEPGDWK